MTSLDRFLLTLCVWREARGESEHGQALVARVVRNRATDARARWPTAIADVITQRWQFSAFNPGDPNATLFPKAGDASWRRAMRAVRTSRTLDVPPVNHYHARGIEPNWTKGHAPALVEGRHVFYVL